MDGLHSVCMIIWTHELDVLYADTNCKLVENVVDKCATNVHTDKANF